MKRRQRVLALLPEAYKRSGGIAQFNRNLLQGLLTRPELEVTAVALDGPRECAVPDGLRWRVPRSRSQIGFALGAVGIALRLRPDMVIGGLVGFGPVSLAIKRLTGARLWSVTHGVEVWDPPGGLRSAALRSSDLITTVSRYTRSRVLDWCPIESSRVRVLHNTIDLTRFPPGPRPEALVSRYDVADRKVLLTVARLASWERYKGHDRILPLLARLRERVGPLRYIIAGSGDDRPRLEHRVRELGVEDLVTFAGFVPDEELLDLYRLADVFVMPSTGEGFGIVFLEAMAAGCPVIGGNRDGSVDALADGDLGRLVDPDSPDELAAAIEETLLEGRRHDRPIPGVERYEIARFLENAGRIAVEALGPG